MKCPKCGNHLIDNTCPICGFSLDEKPKIGGSFIIGTFLLVVLLVVATIIVCKSAFANEATSNNEIIFTDNKTSENVEFDFNIAFSNLTKEEAMKFIEYQTSINSKVPDNFVNDDVKLQSGEKYLELLYSYEKTSEIKEIAKESVFGSNNGFRSFLNNEPKYSLDKMYVQLHDDIYAITYVNPDEIECEDSYCYRGVTFNKKYVNYYDDVIKTEESESHNNKTIFMNLEPSFVKEAMAIIIYISNYSNIYDYTFEETEKQFIYTLHIVGVGFDLETGNYAINFIQNQVFVDKETGIMKWKTDEEGNKNKVLRSININQAEFTYLMDL